MASEPLRILILEDVPMDAELVEYELGRARIPFDARRVDTREGFLRELDEFRPDLILSDYTLSRFDAIQGALARVGARTERDRAEAALRESEERYRDPFENASDLICVSAPDGAFLYANRAWYESMGYTDQDLERLHLTDVVHPDSRQRYREVMERVVGGETLTHVELAFLTSSGESVPVEGNLSCTRRDGRPASVRGIYRDVAERKRIADQLRRAERMQAAGRLAGGVAHEVNNMMTGVIGFAEFLLRSLEPGDSRRAEVEEIIKAGSRAADVTRQLLAFTRQQVLRPELLDLNALVLISTRCSTAPSARTTSWSCSSPPRPARSGPTGGSWSRC